MRGTSTKAAQIASAQRAKRKSPGERSELEFELEDERESRK
jgi:hypothetical protein